MKFKLIFLLVIVLSVVVDVKQSLYASDRQSVMHLLRESIVPLNSLNDNKDIIKNIAEKPIVMIGDSTHGSHEFYQQRINITKQLIQQKKFKLIVLEGDWPNVYSVNQYIQSLTDLTAMHVLNISNPGASWLWGNLEVLNFIVWLKSYNEQLPEGEQKVSIHGIDIYSFHRSKDLVVDYLQMLSPEAAQQAYQRYQCFDNFNNDLHRYGKQIRRNPELSCEKEVLAQYLDFSACHYPCPQQYSFIDKKSFFYAMQNARIIKNTEKSFRLQYKFDNDTLSWNQRDRHMQESLVASMEFLNYPKTIIWAHNSHIGDARATEMADRKQLNLGQLLRQQFGEQVYSIGMLTYAGSVMAADDWGLPNKIKKLLPAHPDSNEFLLHQLSMPHFVFYFNQSSPLERFLNQTRLQRHVGVVYRPDDEMESHYTYTHLSNQFDAIIYIDHSNAVIPLENTISE